jgi:hypothetical protein
MKNILLLFISVSLLFTSCGNDSQKNNIKYFNANTVISFSVTSKNSDLTSKSAKDISFDEMTTINVKS